MVDEILVQPVGVSFQRDDRGIEGLVYAPRSLVPDEPDPDPVCRRIDKSALVASIRQVCAKIEALKDRACAGQDRNGVEVDTAASLLAEQILPEEGLFQLIKPGVHPQWHTGSDIAGAIPWEILEERYLECPESECTWPRAKPGSGVRCCAVHGVPLREAGGKLVLERHLSHRVTGAEGAVSDGMEFLVIADPGGELCSPTHDPTGKCADHFDCLEEWLSSKGYRINKLERENASRARVIEALKNPALGGLYYFGHGRFPKQGGEGYLELSDARLYASEIARLHPRIRFVFLNACHGATQDQTWTLEHRVSGVGQRLPGEVC